VAAAGAAVFVAVEALGQEGDPRRSFPVPELPWSAGMETGDLTEWYAGQDPVPEAEQHSDDGTCEASTDVAHTGRWSMRCVASAEGDATRMFRYAEPRSGIPLVYTAWFYLPRYVRIGEDGNWNVFQFKSKNLPEDRSDPFLSFNLRDRDDGTYSVYVFKKPEEFNIWPDVDVRVRPRQWFGIRSHLRQSGDGTGRLRVWVLRDGRPPVEIIDRSGLSTRYPDGVGVQDWSINNYGAELSPLPAVMFMDDALIARPGGLDR
jgi:hypothetical protein